MAVRYEPLLGPCDDEQRQDEGPVSPLSPASTSLSTSTFSNSGMSPLPSPTPSNYLTLAEQTFTPLSMDGSDFCFSDAADDDDQARAKELEKTGLLHATRVQKHWRMDLNAGSGLFVGRGSGASKSSASTAPAQVAATPATTTGRGRGASTVVSAVVQSFEALRVARSENGYDLISTKSTGTVANAQRFRNPPNPGLVSPPSTASPSPSPSPLQSQSPRPTANRVAIADTAQIVVSAADADAAHAPKAAATPAANLQPQTAEDNDAACPQRPSEPSPSSSSSTSDCAKPSDSSPGTVESPPPTVTARTTLVRPTPVNSPPPTPLLAVPPEPAEPSIVRTSSAASLNLKHPTPDPNKRSRSGACLGNIAALEATAERLSMTSSIEEAIREEHEELKRSDSRRSSLLRANSNASGGRDRKISISDSGSVRGPLLAAISRQSSIVDLNTAARLGGYSPAGYVMSPHPSLSGASARLRSGSKTGSIEVPPVPEDTDSADASELSQDVGNGEDFPFLSRHGAGKMSTRSTRSNLSYVQNAVLDEPIGLTKEAFDEADRAASAASMGKDLDDDETIRASAYQHIEEQFAHVDQDYGHPGVLPPVLDRGFDDLPSPRLQIHQPESHHLYQDDVYDAPSDDRPTTSGSTATYQQAQNAFGDFDGVHCEPEIHDFPPPAEPQVPREPVNPHALERQRPKSYFDPSTGQQMLFYPARVPAMLNLPPKLSKKPKDAARHMRRSQLVVDAMAQESRESRVWLPDPMDGLRGSRDHLPFMTEHLGSGLGTPPNLDQAPHPSGAQGEERALLRPTHSRQVSETSTIHPSAAQAAAAETTTTTAAAPVATEAAGGREIRRPQRLTDTADKRNTRMLDGLPPQLRASAFFDLPASQIPKIEVKGGSAMDTLDSILDASASAPVSAFTDHVFAGKLGSEVYGSEKKKKKAANARKSHTMTKSVTDLQPPSPKKRNGHFSLLGGRRKHLDGDSDEEWTTVGLDDDKNKKRADRDPHSPNELAPGADERSDDSDKESEDDGEEEELYQGPPTTLLAELQLRKQQNKMRTRNITQAYPNGMHSTLLELDAVAEVQRKARHGKRVNLAWEDPNANPDHNDELDDEEVPLGMLYVAKATGMNRSNMDISAVMSEIHRPLGLMERRELEENEPLSRRRERLQGNQNGLIPPTLDVVHQRLSQLHPSPYGALGLRSQSRLALPLPSPGPGSVVGDAPPAAVNADEEGEFEGETLAERKARLAAENPLPRARPVSGMFSSELLSQFGGDDERPNSAGSKGKAKTTNGKENTPPATDVPEEEETLGQRRRRLQAEREARDREFTTAAPALAPVAALAPLGANNTLRPVIDDNRASRRLSMADVLNAHPREGPQGRMDPREADRLQRELELAKAQQEKDVKMAALRAQMPTTLPTANVGARTGGYMNGMFNDSLGGTVAGGGIGMGYASPAMVAQQQRMSMVPPTAAYGAGMGYAPPVGGLPYGGGMPMNMNMMNPGAVPYGYGAPMPVNGQGTDMVERWRQGVMP
ncbi:hypothetical protein QBC34DRAFT_166084 [Podospora aff. communis PSN243]|uniref:Uncharacterized protein n=1 Tax=Podospora aff. communis PSN243 TaxID=3040156 RepID=A0AAV9GDF7_9PEZI|nr:hypothetical protein QBC34DRAFT_166084 [Podospora aff. communis PSN243]